MNQFEELFNLDVSKYVDKRTQGKTELSYLSWAWAWAKVNEVDPNASYEIVTFQDKDGVSRPWLYDSTLGYLVMTNVSIKGQKKTMWLPVMDGANKAMLDHSYQYKTKYDVKTVEAATMFDINKTLMRCLVKNIAMFGLGLKLYAGEDLPSIEISENKTIQSLSQEDLSKIQNAENLDKLKEVCRKLMNQLGDAYTKAIVDEFGKREVQLRQNNNADIQHPTTK